MSSSILDTIASYLASIQRRRIFTKEKFLAMRIVFFQSIGLIICLTQVGLFVYQILKLLFWFPLKLIQVFIPKTTNYNIVVLLLWLCSVIAYSIAKYSHRQMKKRYSFPLIFTVLLLLQSMFILRPIAISIKEQRMIIQNELEVEDRRTTINLGENVSSIEKQDLLLIQQHANHLVDSSRPFSWKFLQYFSQFFPKITEQIKITEQKPSPGSSSSSMYTAFTDLHCYDYTKLVYHNQHNYRQFLNIYRHRSPFPIYVSILKSNGPICYHHVSSSSCAIRSKLQSKLLRFLRFWMLIGLPMIICIIIYNRFRYRQHVDVCKQLSNDESLLKPSDLQPLDENLEKKLRLWLDQERSHGYQNINEACRLAFNRSYSRQDEPLIIESLEYSTVKLRNVSQTSSNETIVINAFLDIDQLIFHLIRNHEHMSMKIDKLTGELEIDFLENRIEIRFKQIQFQSKEPLPQSLKDVIHQTSVQCRFQLSDTQEKTPRPTNLPPIVSEAATIDQSRVIPIITSVDLNQPQILPEKEVKKLLIRIVKAVQLHDVEQPYCILELNHPKQIHQTSLANNGLNPFWDERFLFECNDKSNQIRLQIIDRRISGRKSSANPSLIETIYADVSIPFSYVTSTIYKQDVRITPQYPDSIIRIEFSTLSDDDFMNHFGYDIESITNSPNSSHAGRENLQTPSDEILTLACQADGSLKGYTFGNHTECYSPAAQSFRLNANKPRKSRSFMNSFRLFSGRKRDKQTENGFTPTQPDFIPHSFSAEPVASAKLPALSRHNSISRSFRKFFKRKPPETTNFILDHPDLISVSTPTPKKRSFFRRFRSKPKTPTDFSMNSLTSEDRTRAESVRNTPIRANVGRPVTMT